MKATRIERRPLVERHDPILSAMDIAAPLSLGNGDFAFTADVTGLQTLYSDYAKDIPLCTMSQKAWGWHTRPNAEGGVYTLEDVVLEEFDFNGRTVRYAAEPQPGNEDIYKYVRQNSHRFSLARIAFMQNGEEIPYEALSDIYQRLHLYEGYLDSAFKVNGVACNVKTACAPESDTVAITVSSGAISDGSLTVDVLFPYGDHHIDGAVWDKPDAHKTTIVRQTCRDILLRRTFDDVDYYAHISSESDACFTLTGHRLTIGAKGQGALRLCVTFSQAGISFGGSTATVFADAAKWWTAFWEEGAAVRLSNSKHEKALDLERQIILSQYVIAIQSAGCMPPQETGLVCNSWYGLFHLEMHLWHSANLALWNRPKLLERSLKWYMDILPEARKNAELNGYPGARWPKQTGPDGVNRPSRIATLLLWQQPHILYMIEMLYHAYGQDNAFLAKYWSLISESADFMAGFVVKNADGVYELLPPQFPSYERGDPSTIRNTSFELCYWRFGLELAIRAAERLSKPVPELWRDVNAHMATPTVLNGVYVPHQNYKWDDLPFPPTPVSIYGLVPGTGVNRDIMLESFKRHLAHTERRMGGWAYGNHAMTATRLGMAQEAIDIMVAEGPNNVYTAAGNNSLGNTTMGFRLHIYLPGNGATLLAIAMMAAGYGDSEAAPGFPKNGDWVVETDGLMKLPY